MGRRNGGEEEFEHSIRPLEEGFLLFTGWVGLVCLGWFGKRKRPASIFFDPLRKL